MTRRSAPSPSERLQAVLELPVDHESCAELVAALDDPSLEVVRAALTRLVLAGRSAEASAIRSRMLHCDLALVRDYAWALRGLDADGGAAAALVALGDERYRLRLAGALALEVLAREQDAQSLRSALTDPIAAVRAAALRALRRLNPSAASTAAVAPLLRDPDAGVRTETTETLVHQGEHGLALLNRIPLDPDPGVRRALARHAARLAPEHAALLLRDSDAHVRELAARSAGGRSLPRLADVARADPVPTVRLAAAKRLGELRRPGAVEALINALTDPVGVVRAAALESLEQRLGRQTLVDRLAAELSSRDAGKRRAVLYALARLAPRGGIPASSLSALTRDPDMDVRVALAHAAPAVLPDPREILALLAEDAAPAVRAASSKQEGTRST
jgi:HEAT repeat protein